MSSRSSIVFIGSLGPKGSASSRQRRLSIAACEGATPRASKPARYRSARSAASLRRSGVLIVVKTSQFAGRLASRASGPRIHCGRIFPWRLIPHGCNTCDRFQVHSLGKFGPPGQPSTISGSDEGSSSFSTEGPLGGRMLKPPTWGQTRLWFRTALECGVLVEVLYRTLADFHVGRVRLEGNRIGPTSN